MKEFKINYLVGDATSPQTDGSFIITHIVNDKGGWGAGFVLALSKKWSQPEREYRAWSKTKRKLGNVQFVVVGTNQIVANLVGQEDTVYSKEGVPPVRYSAILVGLEKVFKQAKSMNASVHMPRIASGLAGGRWSIIEKVIEAASESVKHEVDIYVYDFEDVNSPNYVKPNLK